MNITTLATNDNIAKTWAMKEAQISYLEKFSGKEELTSKQQSFISGFLNHLSEDIVDYEGFLFDAEDATEEEVSEGYFMMREKANSLNVEPSEGFISHVNEYLNKELFETLLEDTELTRRSKQCLSRHGVKTVGELVEMTAEELGKVRNFGIVSIEEVTAFISSIE